MIWRTAILLSLLLVLGGCMPSTDDDLRSELRDTRSDLADAESKIQDLEKREAERINAQEAARRAAAVAEVCANPVVICPTGWMERGQDAIDRGFTGAGTATGWFAWAAAVTAVFVVPLTLGGLVLLGLQRLYTAWVMPAQQARDESQHEVETVKEQVSEQRQTLNQLASEAKSRREQIDYLTAENQRLQTERDSLAAEVEDLREIRESLRGVFD